MSGTVQDLRLATRALVRRPGFALTAILTIAIAIGGNTAIFSVVDGVLLQPLPFPHPGELVTLDARANTGFLISTSIPNYRDWRERSRVFRAVGGFTSWEMTRTGHGLAENVSLCGVIGDFFGTLGIAPFLGRVTTDAETGPGAPAVVVLGFGYWQRAFGADPAVVGQTLTLDGRPFTIIGVLPDNTGLPTPGVGAYFPLGVLAPTLPWNDRRSAFGLRMIARLAPKVTLEAARQDLTRAGREVRDMNEADTALPEVRSLTDFFVGDIRSQVWLLMGSVGFVLLIAIANVGNLLLARGEDRRQEMAVRMALGASRPTLIRQVLIESLILAGAGGVLGVWLARQCLGTLLSVFASSLPALSLPRVGLSSGVLGFSLTLTVGTGLLFGLLPALRASRVVLSSELKAGGRGAIGSRERLHASLVVSEIALALVLLVGATLMLQSLDHLRRVDKGFDADRVLTVRTNLSRDGYPDIERWRAFYDDVLTRVKAFPGVRSAAVALLLPLSARSWELGIWPEGVPPRPGTGQSVLYNIVSADYFATLGVQIVRGRGFTDMDRQGADPVAIVDETMAARFWPGQDPINRRVTFETTSGGHGGDPIYRTVVGVARNVRHYELINPSRIQVYVPFTQITRRGPSLAILIKTTGPPATISGPLRTVIATMDPDVPISAFATMQDYVDAGVSGSRAMSGLLGVFGLTALLLAAVGIFGVMSYTVAQRTREIGVRVALGATRSEVIRWVARRALLLGGMGIGLGGVAAVALSHLLSRFLFQVSPADPGAYVGVAGLLLAATLAAALIPARRAARIDPMEALQRE